MGRVIWVILCGIVESKENNYLLLTLFKCNIISWKKVENESILQQLRYNDSHAIVLKGEKNLNEE